MNRRWEKQSFLFSTRGLILDATKGDLVKVGKSGKVLRYKNQVVDSLALHPSGFIYVPAAFH